MKPLGTLARAMAVAGLLCGLTASPALADHHKNYKHHNKGNKGWHGDHHEYRGGSHHSRRYYDYDRRTYYYSEPRARVYVPVPPPPSFGLHLVFPFH